MPAISLPPASGDTVAYAGGTHIDNNKETHKMDIKNSVALVTGTNRGVGRAIVQALVAGGARKV